MSNLATIEHSPDTVWRRYRDNFPRHLLGVTRDLQAVTMRTLSTDCGHKGLRLNFEPYISMIGDSGARLSDLADILGISRQAANQAANQIETAGYVRREPDPTDGRAKLLVLTARGRALRADGMQVVAGYQRQFARIAGQGASRRTISALQGLSNGLAPPFARTVSKTPRNELSLAALLPGISEHISLRLMQLATARGHPALRLSFGKVLLYIGPDGGRIQHIAAINGVSKQAISTIAWELEEQGYIRRERDRSDARQLVLQFTERGRLLITDSVAVIDDLNQEFAEILDQDSLLGLQKTMRLVYHALRLEQDVFQQKGLQDIPSLAGQLRQQLGEEQAHCLGELLLRPTPTGAV